MPNCHTLNTVIAMSTEQLLPTLQCFLSRMHHAWPCVFKLPSLIWQRRWVLRWVCKPYDWIPTHSYSCLNNHLLSLQLSQHNTVLVENRLKQRICNLHTWLTIACTHATAWSLETMHCGIKTQINLYCAEHHKKKKIKTLHFLKKRTLLLQPTGYVLLHK